MKHALALVMVIFGFGGAIVSHGLSVALAAGPHAALMELDDTIKRSSARYLSRAVDVATEDEAELLIVTLNTPGGLFSSTRDMVEKVMAAQVPVVVYVSPSGARAASAGTFVTAAAHVAAMAPGTNIGAASPIAGGGKDLPETLAAKATNDAAALMRSIATVHGRNSEALEDTVFNATSFSATEALEKNIIDLIASDLQDLLAQLDGRPVQLKGGRSIVLQTDGLQIRQIKQTALERFLSFLSNPDIAFLLVTLGSLGIFVELLAPVLIVPGIVGAIALALGLVGLGNLPVNWVGVALLGLAAVMFFAEAHAPGFGFFGIAGIASFILGAFFLFGGFSPPPIETPSFRVSIWLIAGMAAVIFALVVFVVRDLAAARRAASNVIPSTPSLVGQVGMASTNLAPAGTVRVAGENWSAVSDSGEPISEGEEVMVLEVEGLTLKVFRPPEEIELTDEDAAKDPGSS